MFRNEIADVRLERKFGSKGYRHAHLLQCQTVLRLGTSHRLKVIVLSRHWESAFIELVTVDYYTTAPLRNYFPFYLSRTLFFLSRHTGLFTLLRERAWMTVTLLLYFTQPHSLRPFCPCLQSNCTLRYSSLHSSLFRSHTFLFPSVLSSFFPSTTTVVVSFPRRD